VPILKNHKHELFAQSLAKGETARKAYCDAGYEDNRKNAWRLKTNKDVAARVLEIQHASAKSAEITIQTICSELDDAISVARARGQANAMVSAAGLRAKLAGLTVEKVEIGRANEFENCNTTEELLAKVRREAGDDAAELCAAMCGLNPDGEKPLLSGSRAAFRRKLDAYRWRMVDRDLLKGALGYADPDIEVLPEDVDRLRKIMGDFDGLVHEIKARNAKPVLQMPRRDPVEVEKRKMIR
jgi:hypothetical protein